MESDNVDIRDFYFYNTDEFSGTFAAHSTRDAGIDEAEVVRRVAAARTEALDAASQEYEAKIRALEVEKQEAATEVSAELEAATAAAAASTRAHAETERQLAELKNTAEAVAADRDAEEKRKLDAYHSELEEIQRAAEVERNGLQERLALEHSETIQRHIAREQELQEKLDTAEKTLSGSIENHKSKMDEFVALNAAQADEITKYHSQLSQAEQRAAEDLAAVQLKHEEHVRALEESVQKLSQRQLAGDGTSARAGPDMTRLMIYSSDTPDIDDFADMVKCQKARYEFATDGADRLIRIIADAVEANGGAKLKSIAPCMSWATA